MLLGASGDFKIIILVVGLLVLAGGLLLVFFHRRDFDSRITNGLAANELTFERRKHGRRTAVGRLIVCLGVVMSSCYWVHEGLAFAILLGMMLLLILGITVLAYIDMVSVGLKLGLDRMAENNRDTNRAIDAAIAKHKRSQADGENRSPDQQTPDPD
jgi:Tfp pilus assembly protein PilX